MLRDMTEDAGSGEERGDDEGRRPMPVSARRIQVIRPARSPLDTLVQGASLLLKFTGLLRAMAGTRLKMRYRYSVLGWLWAVLQPLALMTVYSFIFSRITTYRTDPAPYAVFVLAGLIPWSFCSTSVSTAAAGMLSHRSLMAKVYFPREVIPLSYVAASVVDLAIALLLLVAMMIFAGMPITSGALWAVLPGFVLVMFVAALCLLVSSIQVRIRDLGVALPLLLQILMFTTPVVYPAAAIPDEIRDLYWLNPLAILVEQFRAALFGTSAPDAGRLAYCVILAILCLVLSYYVFKRIEPTIVDEI